MNVTNTSNAEKEDVEKYSIKESSFESITDYYIIVDFKNESVSGACFINGFFDHMIDTKKCIELLEGIKKYYSLKRDFSSVLEKYMLKKGELKNDN